MTRYERLSEWAQHVPVNEMAELLVSLIDASIDSEDISFFEDCKAPYWSMTGEPLIKGQKPYGNDV